MPEKTCWTLLRKSWITSFQGLNPTKVFPKFSFALAISIWAKEMRWVCTLGTARWIFTFVVLNWQVWVLISADSRLKPVGGKIWYPSPPLECWSQKNTVLLHAKKSWITQKVQGKNITRKRERWWKIYPGKVPKKVFFFGILFCTSSGVRKNAIISYKVDSQNIVDPLRNG